MVAINHSEADVGGRAIHVLAKPIEHLDEAGFQRLRALWSNPPWSIVFAGSGRAAGRPAGSRSPPSLTSSSRRLYAPPPEFVCETCDGGASRDGGASVDDAITTGESRGGEDGGGGGGEGGGPAPTARDGGASVGDAAVAAAAAARDGGHATIRVARNAYRSHHSPARRPVWQSSPPQTWAGRGSRNLRRKHLQRYQVLCWR